MYFDEEIAGLKVVELYDTKLTDPDALKEKFGVAKEEEIIAYIPNKNALTSLFSDVNFLITNKAAYKKKSVIGKLFSRNKSNVVFELEYLPEYVITATENSVNLCNLDKKIHFYDSGFFDSQEQSKSIVEDLVLILNSILKKMCLEDVNRDKRDDFASMANLQAKTDLCQGWLSENTYLIVSKLSCEKEYAYKMCSLLVKDAAMNCNTAGLLRILHNENKLLGEGDISELVKLADETVDKLLKELESTSDNLEDDYYRNIAKTIKNNSEQIKIESDIAGLQKILDKIKLAQAYVELHENPQAELGCITGKLTNVSLERKRVAKLVNKCSYSKNQSMVEVYESIKQGSCTEEQVRWRDSLGISALYYAIAMHNDDAIRSCISIRNAHTLQWYHDNIDYCTAAKYAKLNEDIIKDIFMATDSVVWQDQEQLRSIERKIAVRQKVIEAANFLGGTKYDKMKTAKAEGDSYAVEQYKEELRELKEKVEKTKSEIEELQQFYDEVSNDIQFAFENHMSKCERNIEEIEKSTEPSILIMKYILNNCDLISKYLYASLDEYVCFLHKGIFFSMPSFLKELFYQDIPLFYSNNEDDSTWKFEQENQEQENKQEEKKEEKQEEIKKPYGDSWFSPEAHRDIKKLQKEYRILAKKYHPDNPGGRGDIFADIQNERGTIIENMQ